MGFRPKNGQIGTSCLTDNPYRLSGDGSGPSGGSPQTIRLSGFIASGTAVPIVPRTIQLGGFTAAGTATPIVPRTIQVPEWTGTGSLSAP